MKHVIIMAAVALALAGCNSNESRAKEIARKALKDPDSAKFGDFVEVDSKKRDWACLEVNAKAPSGGYVGAQAARFVKPAGSSEWEFQGIAGTQEDCVRMLHEMQPFEGGPR